MTCYCRDCQAYAHALGNAGAILDDLGGTDIVASLQQHVMLSQGTDALACLSLSDKGLLRWYASCCNTPIANTARNHKLSERGWTEATSKARSLWQGKARPSWPRGYSAQPSASGP